LKKLPDSVKVDCINVNLVPFKGGIEDIFKRFNDDRESFNPNTVSEKLGIKMEPKPAKIQGKQLPIP